MYGAITKQGGDEGRGFSQSDSRPADDEEEAQGSVEVLARDEPNSPESHHPVAGEGDRRKDRAYSYEGIEGGTESNGAAYEKTRTRIRLLRIGGFAAVGATLLVSYMHGGLGANTSSDSLSSKTPQPSNNQPAPSKAMGSSYDAANTMISYCPVEGDMEYSGGVVFDSNGWTITGSGHVNGRASFNLLGGYVAFDMDTSGCADGVNTNLYTISPQSGIDSSGYCDIQENDSSQCMEMDLVENNGDCMMQTTWHTFANSEGSCDEGGCGASATTSGLQSYNASFTTDGYMTVTQNGVAVDSFNNDSPTSEAMAVVLDTMQETGAALWSSQWAGGWVPDASSCPTYDSSSDPVSGSVFTVSNLEIYGTVTMGMAPTACNPLLTAEDDDSSSCGKGCSA